MALITGASRGIGAAIAQRYAAAGAKVVLSSRKQEALDSVAAQIREAGGQVLAHATHMGSEDGIRNLVDQIENTFGGVDILVNNAATNPHFGPLLTSEESHWDKTFDINVKGCFRMVRACVPSMRRRGGGKIINMSSIAGKVPQAGMGIYSITKASVIMLTEVLASELAPDNIQVNVIAPGFVKTKFSQAIWDNPTLNTAVLNAIPQERMATAGELTGIALYLAAPASNFTTGATFVIDGGQLVGSGRLPAKDDQDALDLPTRRVTQILRTTPYRPTSRLPLESLFAVYQLFAIFLNVLTPVFLLVVIGYLAAPRLQLEARTMSKVSYYILAPAFIFNIFSTASIEVSIALRMGFFVITATTGCVLVALAAARFLHRSAAITAAFVLVTAFGNVGNFGLPIIQFRLGEEALSNGFALLSDAEFIRLYGWCHGSHMASGKPVERPRVGTQDARHSRRYSGDCCQSTGRPAVNVRSTCCQSARRSHDPDHAADAGCSAFGYGAPNDRTRCGGRQFNPLGCGSDSGNSVGYAIRAVRHRTRRRHPASQHAVRSSRSSGRS